MIISVTPALDTDLAALPLRKDARLRDLVVLAGLGCLVFASAYVSILMTRATGHVASIWPVNAILVSAILSRPGRDRAAILGVGLLANMAAGVAVGDAWTRVLILPLLNGLEVIICTELLRFFRQPKGRFDVTRPGALMLFCAVALGPAPVLSNLLGGLVMAAIGDVGFSDLFLTKYPADVLGLLAITPPLLVLKAGDPGALGGPRRGAETAILLTLFATVVAAVFWQTQYPLLFMLFPLATAVAFRTGFAGATGTVALTAFIAFVATLLGHGPVSLVAGGLRERVFVLQVFIAILAVTVFEIAAILAERARLERGIIAAQTVAAQMEREKAERESQFRLITERANDVIIRFSLDETLTYLSPSAERVTGYPVEDLLGTRISDYMHPDDIARVRAIFTAIAAAGPQADSPRTEYRFRHKGGAWMWIEVNPTCLFEAGVPVGFVDIVRDATVRKRIEEELTLARVEAEVASKAKTDFLALISHEIRTPLNGIMGYTDLLIEDGSLRSEQRRHVELIERSGGALLTIINDVLDFSKIEAGQITLDPGAFALRPLVDGALSIVGSLADKKGLSLEAMVDPEAPAFLIGDAARIRQVLLNLLNNAIKFTVRGAIKLEIACEGAAADGAVALRFCVRDTGIGIPESKFDRLFKRFSQVDDSITRDFGGTGLGLAISQNFVAMMGGTIGVESQVGTGSTFWFRVCLPVSEPTAVTLAADPARSATRARVLLVEDLELNQQLAKAVLQAAGHDVTIASDGVEAVMAVQQDDYDVVLMDLQMPRMDGLTATRYIRALDHRARTVPIIAMTANVLPAQIEQMQEAGMDDHVGKPFKRDQLHAAIKRALDRKVEAEEPIMADDETEAVFDQATFDECIDAVGVARIGGLLSQLAVFVGRFRDTLAGTHGTPEEQVRLIREAHKMIAAAGMLGFLELSRLCRVLEGVEPGTHEVDALTPRLKAASQEVIARIDVLLSQPFTTSGTA